MDGKIIRTDDDPEARVVSIGDGQTISMKAIQNIYNEITGKREKLVKNFSDNYEAIFEDIKQLNIKVEQLYEQYHVVSKNCAITLYHLNDCTEVFSSFERFEFYDSSSLSPIENIRLEYNFLIVLPNTNRPQSYKIELNLVSRVTLKKRTFSEGGIPRRLIRLFSTYTAKVEVEYIDYAVARNFLVAIEHWYASIRKNKSSKFLVWLQDNSEHFSFSFKLLTTTFMVLALFYNHRELLGPDPTIQNLFGISILAMGGVFIMLQIASKLGRICEEGIDSYQPISGLKLNRGDQIAVTEYLEGNRASLIKAIVSALLAIGINLFSTWLASRLGV